MRRVLEHCRPRPDLDDLARIHDHDAMADALDHVRCFSASDIGLHQIPGFDVPVDKRLLRQLASK
jgi:hypothetical protein